MNGAFAFLEEWADVIFEPLQYTPCNYGETIIDNNRFTYYPDNDKWIGWFNCQPEREFNAKTSDALIDIAKRVGLADD